MDQGDAAVWAAGISVVGAAVGAVGGYLAGRAQGKATVDGVQLQLAGQRQDALWQAEVDAYAALVTQFNLARMQLGDAVALFEARGRDLRHLEGLGRGTREESFAALLECVKECVSKENALRLRTAPAYADVATDVRRALLEVTSAVQHWCVTRTGGPGNGALLRREVDTQMDTFRSALDRLVEDAQARFSRPRPL